MKSHAAKDAANHHAEPKAKVNTYPEVSEMELAEYEMVEEKYVAVDLRKVHSTFLGASQSDAAAETENPAPPQSLETIHFIVLFPS